MGFPHEEQKPGHSGLGGAEPDEVGQVGSLSLGHGEASAKVVPERDAQLGAGQQWVLLHKGTKRDIEFGQGC